MSELDPSQTASVLHGAGTAPTVDDRLAGLSPTATRRLRSAGQHLLKRDIDQAERDLADVLAETPDHAEALRLQGVVHQLRGRPREAIAALQRSLEQRPNDALIINTLGGALNDAGYHDKALAAFRHACELDPKFASAWLNLGSTLLARGDATQAEAALARAVEFQPRHTMAHVAHGDALVSLGRIDDAAAEYRAALRLDDGAVQAWKRLADLPDARLDASELDRLHDVHARAGLSDYDRSIAGFALGKALENEGRHQEAFAVFASANAAQQRLHAWNAADFSARIDEVTSAFASPIEGAKESALGSEVIFIVGVPRSGATLIEQVIAAHPDVEGADELPDLMAVIQEESRRRDEPFPGWVGKATPQDWERLGRRYLEVTRRWRQTRPKHVDRTLSNWTLIGAAMAMLPGARFVNSRRDPVETSWSCYKQLFARGQRLFCYDLDDIAAYWLDYNRLMFFWHARHSSRIYELKYENLIAAPEREIRALLDFCGLPFDSACLRPHKSGRVVRTAGAADVRQPIAARAPRTPGYGALLDPLRGSLQIR